MLTLTHCSGFGGAGGIKRLLVDLSVAENNVNLANKLTALGWNGVEPVDVTVTVAPGVLIGGSYALTIPALPTGSPPVKLVNAGRIQGRGGNGGSSGASPGGAAGGPALFVATPVWLSNSGVIAGGGGGGGGSSGSLSMYGGGGGGGAGIPGGGGGGGGMWGGSGGGSGTPYGGGSGGGGGAWRDGETGESGTGPAGSAGGAPGGGGGGAGGAPGNWVTGYAYLTIVSNTGTLAGGTA